jgi:arginine exporter protein ArgO
MLAAVAIRGLRSVRRGRSRVEAGRAAGGRAAITALGASLTFSTPLPRHGSPSAEYVRFLAITTVNPLTIVSFASVAASLSLTGFLARVAFVTGVGAASASWQLSLTLAAGHACRRITPAMQRAVSIGGRLIVLGVAMRFALAT